MHATRILGTAGLLAILAIGCSVSPDTAPRPTFDEKKMVSEALRKIAEDKSVSDEETFQLYLKRYPYKPTVYVTGDGPNWAVFEKKGDGYNLRARRYDRVFFGRMSTSEFDPIQYERDGLKSAAEFCELFLTDLGPRNLKSIDFTYLGMLKADPSAKAADEIVFRCTATPANLPKLREHRDTKPDAGTVYDPRGDKIDTLWKVETNQYPAVTYKKRDSAKR